jgi:hypothetical protein
VELGWRSLGLSYPLQHARTAAIQRLTPSAAGWLHRPGLQLVNISRQGGAALVQRLEPSVAQANRQGRFTLIPWRDLPVPQRQNLGSSLQAPAWACPNDDPGQDALQQLDPEISCVLLDHQQPIGWLIAHRVGDRLFRVSQWWVQPQRQGQGTALLLLHRAIAGALASPIGYHSGAFGMEPSNSPAIRLCQRKILPHASGVSQQQHAWLLLCDGSLERLHAGLERRQGSIGPTG